jgi:DNA-binding beta-propeller fold protein YncE
MCLSCTRKFVIIPNPFHFSKINGENPTGVAVDPIENKLYVANERLILLGYDIVQNTKW